MIKINLDMYQTLAVAVGALMLGNFLRKKISVLRKFCIPAPVTGGIVFAIISCIIYVAGLGEITYTDTLREVCMVFFFTSVGFQADLKVLKSGGKALIALLVLVWIMIIAQNGIVLGLTTVMGGDPLLGLCIGSIPMVGGHGTAGAFGPILEDLGLSSATTVCTAAATYGLIAGSLIGGPISDHLIRKKDLLKTSVKSDDVLLKKEEKSYPSGPRHYGQASFQLIIAVGIGTIITSLLSATGITFPVYIGAMIAAAVIRNVGEYSGKYEIYMFEINGIGGVMMSLFLGIAMISLKIWQLAELALPLMILLFAQTVFMIVFARFVVFNMMGRDYDAAVITAGTCGFGMGATPNAMANMQAICEKYAPSIKAYLLIPIVGGLFTDFINSLTITFIINML